MGFVSAVADGIVNILGLTDVRYGETLNIHTGRGLFSCLVLNIEYTQISAILLDSDSPIRPGQYASNTGYLLSIPVGVSLLGRIVNPIGYTLDGKGNYDYTTKKMVESIAPSIISRSPVNEPMESGLKVIDSLIPIGHGQRELIIGDSKTGKTTIALDTILNQKVTDNISIYVAIGQKRSSVARISKILKSKDCLRSTVIVAATASDPAALQYIAPYSGVAIGEFFMEFSLKILIIFDDLSKHAVSYRQLSLLLRRPPGREGYPGDVFYTHSRLLERAANLKNSGSITALPIVETIQGDVSAYIPTNVISITDGQLFLDKELFSLGIRPSVSPGFSVSRVGSAAQNDVLKRMAGNLKLELAQFREVERFSKLGFVLDESTKKILKTGNRLTKLLVQNKNNPFSMDKQILFLKSSIEGYIS